MRSKELKYDSKLKDQSGEPQKQWMSKKKREKLEKIRRNDSLSKHERDALLAEIEQEACQNKR